MISDKVQAEDQGFNMKVDDEDKYDDKEEAKLAEANKAVD